MELTRSTGVFCQIYTSIEILRNATQFAQPILTRKSCCVGPLEQAAIHGFPVAVDPTLWISFTEANSQVS
jgi:hypothetical protein